MTNALDRALAAATTRQDEVLPMLERWVRTNSFSGNMPGVNAMADLLARDFDLDGLVLERHPGDGVGDHLFWRTPAWDTGHTGGRDRQVLIGHHDTVFPPGTFEVWQRDGDRLRGPGVLDMKGGLAVIRAALAALADAGVLAEVPLALISVGDEEIGSRHSRPLVQSFCKGAAAALVFEAGRAGDKIITRRKGTGRLTVRVEGRAAHAGNHHADGVNAIWALARFIDAAQQHTDYDAGTTVNVGLIRGGTSANTVPAEAECTIDFRHLHLANGHAVVESLTQLAADIAHQTGTRVHVTGGVTRAPLERSEASVALYRTYAACARAAGLGADECPLIGGGSDANTVSEIGVPAIDGLGPRGSGFHTHDEVIEVSSLAIKTEALVRYLVRCLPA